MNKNLRVRLIKVANQIKVADQAYNAKELGRANTHIQQLQKAPLEARKESAKEWYDAISTDPQIVADRIGWLFSGNYGYGEMLLAQRILAQGKGANKVAALSLLIAALEWMTPSREAIAMWKKLSAAQQRALKSVIEKEIIDYTKRKEGEDKENTPEKVEERKKSLMS